MDDSPPSFIVIRTPRAPERTTADPYQEALALVELVAAVQEVATVRFHLKDRLDKTTTSVVLELAKVEAETPANRWKAYRRIVDSIVAIISMLDIIERQHATAPITGIEPARSLARRLLESLRPHALLGP